MSKYRSDLTRKAKERRKDPVCGERWVWHELRKFRKAGLVFRREQPFGQFILDFYCPKLKLAIEIDGLSHDTKRESDNDRDAWLQSQIVTVMRFPSPRNISEAPKIATVIERQCLDMGWVPSNTPNHI